MVGALEARYAWLTCPASHTGPGTTIPNGTFIWQHRLLRGWGCGKLPTVKILTVPKLAVIYNIA